MQKATGNEAIGYLQLKKWFKEGQTSVESDKRLGRPSTSRNQMIINKVPSAMMLDKWRITIRQLSDELELSFGSVQSILTEDLAVKHVPEKFVP
jgi:hypothetical protein